MPVISCRRSGEILCVELLLRGDGARVAITERIGERMVVGVEADVVHGPAIDGDGADAFRSDFGGATQTIFDASFDAGEVPAQAVVIRRGPLGKRWTSSIVGGVPVPAQQGDAAALGTEVNRDEARADPLDFVELAGLEELPAGSSEKGLHEPPSTGMR